MPTEKKTPQAQRETILVNILERLSGQLSQFEDRLEKIEKNQLALPGLVEKAGSTQNSGQPVNDAEFKKINDSIVRYRSDMLSLVNEQDRLNDRINDLLKRQDAIAGAQEVIGRDTSNLGERFGIQEKAVSEHSAYSVKQREEFIKELDGVNRNNAKLYLDLDKRLDSLLKDVDGVNRNSGKLHVETEKRLEGIGRDIANVDRNANKLYVDTEKHLKDEHRETQRQLDELRRETMRRLLALDKIESTLEVLLIRTEPPEKKTFFLVRVFHIIGRFFGVKVPGAFRRILRRRRDRV